VNAAKTMGRVTVLALSATAELLCDHLRADRYEAFDALTVGEAVVRARESDALVLDLALEGAETTLVALGAGAPPTVALASASAWQARRELEKRGATVLTKPAAWPDIAAVIARAVRGRHETTRVAGLVIEPGARAVSVDGQRVELASKELVLLRALAREPNRVVSKGELLREVFGPSAAGRTRMLDAHASRLRRKLAAAGGERFVHNAWGVGYRLLGH
jgi:DNA-binding response OmpR family regulator